MVNFYLPYSQAADPSGQSVGFISILFTSFAHTEPHKLIENANIAGLYGIPGSTSVWSGGRHIPTPPMFHEFIDDLALINSYDVSFCFTFTNALLTERELGDTQGNTIMELGHNGMNSVIVTSPLLEEYLRDRYPNYKYISSVTKCEDDVNTINEECEKYDLVVPNHFYNKDWEFLKQIKHPEKIKLLADSFCSSYCKKSAYHYRLISEVTSVNFPPEFVDPTFQCNIRAADFVEALKFKDTISNTDIYGKYSDMGFEHFKLEGRTDHLADVIASYTYYMVKPEYRDELNLRLTKIAGNAPVGTSLA